MNEEPEFTILQDTREQHPWSFNFDPDVVREVAHLKTGDYTVKGLDNILCIERKATAEEVAINLVSDFARFKRELQRMDDDFLFCYAIFEFPYSHLAEYPAHVKNLRVRNKIKVNGGLLVRRLYEIQLDHKIKVMFCDNKLHAAKSAVSLMRRVNGRYAGRTT